MLGRVCHLAYMHTFALILVLPPSALLLCSLPRESSILWSMVDKSQNNVLMNYSSNFGRLSNLVTFYCIQPTIFFPWNLKFKQNPTNLRSIGSLSYVDFHMFSYLVHGGGFSRITVTSWMISMRYIPCLHFYMLKKLPPDVILTNYYFIGISRRPKDVRISKKSPSV